MNKKILIISIFAVFMLMAISFASAINFNTEKTVRTKESPLFRIWIRRAIREKIGDLIRWFIGERVFFLPFQWLINIRDNSDATCKTWPTCPPLC